MKLLSTLAAAALTVLGALPATASQRHYDWVQRARAAAQAAGIGLYQRNDCPHDMAGFYHRRSRTIFVCQAAGTPDAVVETIAHEMTHAAQHCLGGHQMVPIYRFIRDQGKFAPGLERLIAHTAATRGEDIGYSRQISPHQPYITELEAEAYALEGEPEVALQMFTVACD